MVQKVITIDGPAAAGKTTLARHLSKALNAGVLNSGALYRAATWVMRQRKLQTAESALILKALEESQLRYEDLGRGSICIRSHERDITSDLYNPELTREIKIVANAKEIRNWMNRWQKEICQETWHIAEGRDQGTEVFPEAAVKFFLTASFDIRVERRFRQLQSEGVLTSFQEVQVDLKTRDAADIERPMGALRKSDDALEIDSTELDQQQVCELGIEYIKKQLENQEGGLPEALFGQKESN